MRCRYLISDIRPSIFDTRHVESFPSFLSLVAAIASGVPGDVTLKGRVRYRTQAGSFWLSASNYVYQPRMTVCRLKYLLRRHKFGIMETAMSSGRGMTQPVLFFSRGPRAGASGEKVSRHTTGLKKRSITGRHFRRKETIFIPPFLDEPVAGTLRRACKTLRATIGRIGCAHRTDIKQNI